MLDVKMDKGYGVDIKYGRKLFFLALLLVVVDVGVYTDTKSVEIKKIFQ